jgi:hypothetical protein
MGLEAIPGDVRAKFRIEERRHACAIMAVDFPSELGELVGCLRGFQLLRSEIIAEGGGKTKIANRIDTYLKARGWQEKSTEVKMTVDGAPRQFDTHKVDLCKNRVAVEVEWNNKDPFFSRDLNAFRLLHDLGVISVGVLITRSDELQNIFDDLGWLYDKKYGRWKRIGDKYGASTTHWGKLMPRVEAGGNGSCPLLLVGIRPKCYKNDCPSVAVVATPPEGESAGKT